MDPMHAVRFADDRLDIGGANRNGLDRSRRNAKNAFYASHDAADRSAHDRSHGSGVLISHGGAIDDASGNALRQRDRRNGERAPKRQRHKNLFSHGQSILTNASVAGALDAHSINKARD